jgi:hypothetical protein
VLVIVVCSSEEADAIPDGAIDADDRTEGAVVVMGAGLEVADPRAEELGVLDALMLVLE